MKTIKFKNVDVASLRSLFTRSLTVTPHLYFVVTPTMIEAFTANQPNTFCKEWSTSIDGIIEHDNDFDQLKFFFLHGDIFSNKILPNFDKVEMILKVGEGDKVTEISLVSVGLEFVIKTTNIDFANTISKDAQINRFDTSSPESSFSIHPTIIKEITSLSAITEFSDSKIDYIEFNGKDGVLVVSNNLFSKNIGEYEGDEFDAKMHKSFLSLIDGEEHMVHLCTDISGAKKFIFESKHAEIKAKSCAVLMTTLDIDTELSIDDEEDSW